MAAKVHAEVQKFVNAPVDASDGSRTDMSYVPSSGQLQTPEQVAGHPWGNGGLIKAPLRTLMVAWLANVTLDGNWVQNRPCPSALTTPIIHDLS